jgi:hypothetical protein
LESICRLVLRLVKIRIVALSWCVRAASQIYIAILHILTAVVPWEIVTSEVRTHTRRHIISIVISSRITSFSSLWSLQRPRDIDLIDAID